MGALLTTCACAHLEGIHIDAAAVTKRAFWRKLWYQAAKVRVVFSNTACKTSLSVRRKMWLHQLNQNNSLFGKPAKL